MSVQVESMGLPTEYAELRRNSSATCAFIINWSCPMCALSQTLNALDLLDRYHVTVTCDRCGMGRTGIVLNDEQHARWGREAWLWRKWILLGNEYGKLDRELRQRSTERAYAGREALCCSWRVCRTT